VKTLPTNNFDEASDSAITMIYRSICIVKFFLARLFHPETRRLRGNVVIPSVARAAEEMVLNAVEADASVVEADELVSIFFFSLNFEVFTCGSIAILSIKIGFDLFLLLITRDLRVFLRGVLQLGVTD